MNIHEEAAQILRARIACAAKGDAMSLALLGVGILAACSTTDGELILELAEVHLAWQEKQAGLAADVRAEALKKLESN